MEDAKFDALARRLAPGETRRSFAKRLGLVGVAAAVSLGRLESAEAAQCRVPGEICRKPGDCCSGDCGPVDSSGRRRCECTQNSDCPTPRSGWVSCVEGTCTVGTFPPPPPPP